MIEASYIWVILWAGLVGMDLATAPQVMIARPIVAGSVTGFLLGDFLGGFFVGAALEMFAFDLLPVGASRYSDFGVGAVAAAVAIAGSPTEFALGIAVAVGLVTAWAAGIGIHIVRKANTREVEEVRLELDSGDAAVVNDLQLRGALRDLSRAMIVAVLGVLLAATVKAYFRPSTPAAVTLTVVAVGAALAAAGSGAVNCSGRAKGFRMFGLGVIGGLAWTVLL
ncbi:MAG: PTS sugar transporter subunit IIC [Gemmatimonadales bacterium]